jgi:hypothetical protein
VSEWLATAVDVASAHVSERRSDDPPNYRRICIAEGANSGPTDLIHTSSIMDIWILFHVSPELESRRFETLRDAENYKPGSRISTLHFGRGRTSDSAGVEYRCFRWRNSPC